MHISGSLAFSEFFLPINIPYPGQITFWKYNVESIFGIFLNNYRNSSKKIIIEIWTLSFQIGFWNQFLTSGSGKTKNMQIRVFLVWPLPDVWNWFQKQIWNESVHISVQNFFKEFQSIFRKFKKMISYCLFKKWFDRGRVHFLTKFFSKTAKLPKICLSFCGAYMGFYGRL